MIPYRGEWGIKEKAILPYSPQISGNTFLHDQRKDLGKVIGENGVVSYRTETFYQGMRESLTISTYFISINSKKCELIQ